MLTELPLPKYYRLYYLNHESEKLSVEIVIIDLADWLSKVVGYLLPIFLLIVKNIP